MEPHSLTHDTAVSRLKVAPGWYTANLPEAWNIRTPSGGVLMTVALRAMQEEVGDPDLRLLSAHTHFCSPVPAGPLEIRVEVLRHGGAAAQVRAQLSSTTMPGPGLEVSATFGREREGFDIIDVAPPDVPRADAAAPVQNLAPFGRFRLPFFEQVDTRLALGQPWWSDDWHAGPARLARWFRYKIPTTRGDGSFDPLALPPIADTMPPALIQKLGPHHQPFFAPSLDLTVHFLEDTPAQWLLTDAHVSRARGGFAHGEVQIWDERGALVAVATQMMMLRSAPEA